MNRTMTVAQLSSYLRGVFDDEELLHDVTLIGEVTEVTYSDRHTFIVLAEGAYSVRCVHFSSRDALEKGMRVALRGSVSFYDKRNSVSFSYKEFFLRGAGDKLARFNELKQKLALAGIFENRPQLPAYITDVTVITSPDGAAIRDFIRVVHDKNPFVRIRVYPVKVQGDGAARQMTDAVNKLQRPGTDAIVLCRGGGSDEDLDSFNDEQLALAVAHSSVPVISAVGHEVDYTLCDFCAGTRAGTPSMAGEIVNAHASDILSDLARLSVRIAQCVQQKLAAASRKTERLGTATTRAVSARVAEYRNDLKTLMRRGGYALNKRADAMRARTDNSALMLKSCVQAFAAQRKARLDKLSALLSALDPHRIIKVGYAAVRKNGKSIAGATQLQTDDNVELVFADGSASAVITEVKRATV